MNDKQLAPIQALVVKLQSDQMQKNIAESLPAHVSREKFIRSASSILQNTDLAKMVNDGKITQKSILSVCTRAAQDGLLLDGREAAIVPFKGAAQYIPMVQGILKKARNSGQISKLEAVCVHDGDDFSFNPGIDEVPQHNPDWFGKNRGEMIGVYAVAKLKDGNNVVEIMSREQIMAIAGQSRNKHQYTGDHAGEWWRKTVLRRICKYLPSSTDLDGAFGDYDDSFDYDDSTASVAAQDETAQDGAQTPTTTVDAMAAAMDAGVNKSTGEIIDAEIIDETTTGGDDEPPI